MGSGSRPARGKSAEVSSTLINHKHGDILHVASGGLPTSTPALMLQYGESISPHEVKSPPKLYEGQWSSSVDEILRY